MTVIDKLILCHLFKALSLASELFYESTASTVMFETNYVPSVNSYMKVSPARPCKGSLKSHLVLVI